MHKFQVSGLTKENVIGWGIKGISVTVIFNDLFFKICKLRKIKFEDWRKLDNEVKKSKTPFCRHYSPPIPTQLWDRKETLLNIKLPFSIDFCNAVF